MKRTVNEELLIKVLVNEASLKERLEVENWLKESSENAKKYTDLKLIWESSKDLAVTKNIDENEAWNRFEQRVKLRNDENTAIEVRKSQISSWLKVAATLVLVSLGAWLSYMAVINSIARNTLIVVQTSNETKVDTLSDGSIITLNKNSRLSYPKRFANNSRTINLEEGEAFFTIHPNASKPFIVHVNDVQVKVVGTSFNIKALGDNTELIVETGIVEVRKKDVVIRLKKNERVEIDDTKDSFEKMVNTDQLYKYYRSKEFVVDNTPLWRLVEVLNEAYDSEIIIKEKALENIPLNTTFKNTSLDAIVNIICQTLNIEADKRGKQVILHK